MDTSLMIYHPELSPASQPVDVSQLIATSPLDAGSGDAGIFHPSSDAGGGSAPEFDISSSIASSRPNISAAASRISSVDLQPTTGDGGVAILLKYSA